MPVTTRIVTSLVRNPELNLPLPVTGWEGRSVAFKLKVNCPEFSSENIEPVNLAQETRWPMIVGKRVFIYEQHVG